MISKPTGLYPDNEAVSLGNVLHDDINLFITKGSIKYSIIDENGNIDTNMSGRSSYYTAVTPLISIKPGLKYSISGYLLSNRCAWYDRDGNVVKDENDNPCVFMLDTTQSATMADAPSDAAFIRITYRNRYSSIETNRIVLKEAPLYSDGICLSCQVLSNSEIETFTDDNGVERANVMLIIWDNDRYYHFYFGENSNGEYAPRVIYGDYATEIRLELGGDDISSVQNGYYYEAGTSHLISKITNMSLVDILTRPGRSYSWKLRLYEKGSFTTGTSYTPSEKVGYGSVAAITDVFKSSGSGAQVSYTQSGYNLNIFPHVNIYDKIVEVPDGNVGSEYKGEIPTTGQNGVSYYTVPNVSNTLYNISRNYDDNIKYWIDVNGYILPIDKYRLYPYKSDYVTSTGDYKNGLVYQSSGDDSCFDSYGNPLVGYAVIDNDSLGDEFKESGSYSVTKVRNKLESKTYNIRTNYIDSDWAYFMLYNPPTITMYDDSNNIIDDSSTNSLTHSSIDLSISYSQSEGIGINYWSYKIYRYDEQNEDYVLDYYSGNQYSHDLNLSYDKLLGDKTYKVFIILVDNNQRVFERTVYYETDFPQTDINLVVDVAYYEPHASLIVDWSNINSIMPSSSINIDDCEFVAISDDPEDGYTIISDSVTENVDKCLYIPSGSSVKYTENHRGTSLDFSDSTLTVKFYGTDLTDGRLFEFGSRDGFHVEVDYISGERLRICSNLYCYDYPLYGSYSTESLINELQRTSPVVHSDAPVIWDDNLVWDDSYYWNEHNNINAHWQITVSPTGVTVSGLSSYCELYERCDQPNRINNSDSSFITLNGDIIYDYVKIENSHNEVLFECDFDGHMNGANVATDLTDLIGWRVYKTLGESDKLYEIANLTSNDSCIIEDFAVGDNCKYVYYVYPLILRNGYKTISTPMISKPIEFNRNVDKVFGLRQIGHRIYEVIPDQVWRLYLNLEDSGYTYNTDKNFYDTFNRYNQETVGNRKYITKSIGGMLGYIDCAASTDGIIDTYDMLVSWNEFSGSANLKCLVDARGLILPGNFEANPSVAYDNIKGAPASAKFTWRQTSDLDIIKIYATSLSFNPTLGTYFKSSDDYYLLSSEPNILYTSK